MATRLNTIVSPTGILQVPSLKQNLTTVFTNITPATAISYGGGNAPVRIPMVFSNTTFNIDSNNTIVFPRNGQYIVTISAFWQQNNSTGTPSFQYVRVFDGTGKNFGQHTLNISNVSAGASFVTSPITFLYNATTTTGGLYFDFVGAGGTTNLQINGTILQIFAS